MDVDEYNPAAPNVKTGDPPARISCNRHLCYNPPVREMEKQMAPITKRIIVLAMHGAPPSDFPVAERAELFRLKAQISHAVAASTGDVQARYAALETKMRTWPRTAANDPFYAASHTLAAALRQTSGGSVVVGFNEFCAPSIDEALDLAQAAGADEVIAVTPMMTPGGAHAEHEIPAAVAAAQVRHPGVVFRYAWPFNVADVAGFLFAQIDRAVSG